MENDNSVGRKIQEIRKQQKMSQAELAKASGLTQSWVSRYERGGQLPGSKKLEAIAKALKVPVSAFFTESKQLKGIMNYLDEHLADSEKASLGRILDSPQNRQRLFQLLELLAEEPKATGGLVDNLLALTHSKK